MDDLADAARDAGAYVVVGICERRPGMLGTLYNTQLFLGPDGSVLGLHRKLTPTVGERLVHTGGHGDTLHAYETEFGRVSGLICGENSNPLAVFALIAKGTAVHVASWPPAPARGMLSRAERALMTGRAVAFSAKAFVLNVCGAPDAGGDRGDRLHGRLYAEIDLERCVHEKVVHDLAGHYNRSDVFTLLVRDEPPELLRRVEAEQPAREAVPPADD